MADSDAEKLDQLDGVVDAGASKVTVDGVTTEMDLAAVQRRRRELRAKDRRHKGKRPVCAAVDLSGF